MVWATFGVILGGRLGWDLIYGTILCSVSPDCRFLPTACRWRSSPIPASIIAAWEGGMSFHGGLLGVVIAVWLFCRRQKLKISRRSPIWPAPSRRSACSSGRIANFVNDELWGRVTDVPWAMIFPARRRPLPRHPSQLYEAALEGVLLFVICRSACACSAPMTGPA